MQLVTENPTNEKLMALIGHSVKISKQALIVGISAEIKKAEEKLQADAKHNITFFKKVDDKVLSYATNEIKLILDNDSELTQFRKTFIRLSKLSGNGVTNKLPKNSSIIDHIRIHDKKGSNLVGAIVYTKFPDFNDDYSNLNLSWTYDIELPTELDQLRIEQKALSTKYNLDYDNLRELKLKLNNIDGVLESIEAKILLDELNKSEDGRRALEITSNILSQVVPNTNLLEAPKP